MCRLIGLERLVYYHPRLAALFSSANCLILGAVFDPVVWSVCVTRDRHPGGARTPDAFRPPVAGCSFASQSLMKQEKKIAPLQMFSVAKSRPVFFKSQ